MILVSISSKEDKFVIRLKHKIDFVKESQFWKTKSLNKRTVCVFCQLFISIAELFCKEVLVRSPK